MAYTKDSGMLVRHVIKNATKDQRIALVDMSTGDTVDLQAGATRISPAWYDYPVDHLSINAGMLVVGIEVDE